MKAQCISLKFSIIIFILLVCTETRSYENNYIVSEMEILLVEEFPNVQFVYMPEDVRSVILELHDKIISNENCQFWDNLSNDANIVFYKDLLIELPIIIDFLHKNRSYFDDSYYKIASDLLEEYNLAIVNGDALVESDDFTEYKKATNNNEILTLFDCAQKTIRRKKKKVCVKVKVCPGQVGHYWSNRCYGKYRFNRKYGSNWKFRCNWKSRTDWKYGSDR